MNTKKATDDRYYEIVSGPNTDKLFDACKYAYDKTSIVAIDFSIAVGYTMPKDHPGSAYIPMSITDIVITSVEHEDGSGESFNLHGYCKADLRTLNKAYADYKPYRFKAYYNTKHREGCISFE